MNQLLNHKFYKLGVIIYNIIFLNFLITLFSIPIITLGPALRAGKKMDIYDTYMSFTDFFFIFKNEIYKTLLVFTSLISLLIIDIYLMFNLEKNIFLDGFLLFILVEIFVMLIYLLYSKNYRNIKLLILNSNVNIIRNSIFGIITIGTALLIFIFPIISFFIFPILIRLSKIFKI